jgi:hypothetical protein
MPLGVAVTCAWLGKLELKSSNAAHAMGTTLVFKVNKFRVMGQPPARSLRLKTDEFGSQARSVTSSQSI